MTDRMVVLADDLSGAAEVGSLLRGRDGRHAVTVCLWGPDDGAHVCPATRGTDVVIDLDTRNLPPADRRSAVATALRTLAARGEHPRFCKIDSLLRGGIGDLVDALAGEGLRPVIAPALPALKRTTRAGRVFAGGRSLHDTGLVALETEASDDVAAAIEPRNGTVIPVRTVRAGGVGLLEAVHAAFNDDRVPIIDAEFDSDLDIVATTLVAEAGIVFVGSGGLAAALSRARDPAAVAGTGAGTHGDAPYDRPTTDAPQPHDVRPGDGRHTSVLVVVGTATGVATTQLAALRESGVPVVELSHGLLHGRAEGATSDGPPLDAVRAVLASGGAAALAIAGRSDPDLHSARPLVAGLAAAATDVVGRAALVLTGGETARAVLTRLDARALTVHRSLEHGCVLTTTEDNRAVVTRPGSFGSRANLVSVVRALQNQAGLPPLTARRRHNRPIRPQGKAAT